MKKKRKSFSVPEKMTSVSCFLVGRIYHNFGLVLQLTSTMVKKKKKALIVLGIYFKNCSDLYSLHVLLLLQCKAENKDMFHNICSASKGLLHTCMYLRFSLCVTELCTVNIAQYADNFLLLTAMK